MLTFDEDQIIETMQLVVARRRKAQEQHKQETADNLGELTAASETEKNRTVVCSRTAPILSESEPTVNFQDTE